MDMSSLLGEVSVEVRADLDKLLRGFAQARTETNGFDRDMRRVTKATLDNLKEQNRLEVELRQLARTYDPLTAAALRYGDALVKVAQLERAGVGDAMMLGRIRAGAAREWQEATNRLHGGATKSAEGMAAMGFAASTARGLLGGLVAMVGIHLVRSLARFVEETLKSTAAIKTFANEVGLTTDQVQEYRGIAKEFGLSQDEMDRAFRQLSETVSDAAAGLERPKRLFDLLGIAIRDAGGQVRPTNDIFNDLISKLGQVGNEAEMKAGLMVAFGDSVGAKMAPLVAAGTDRITELRQALAETGMVLSEDQIQKADETAKKLEQVKAVLAAKVAATVVENAEAISTLADALLTVASVSLKAAGSFPDAMAAIANSIPPVVAEALRGIPILGAFVALLQAVGGGGSGAVRGLNVPGRSVTVKLPAAKPAVDGSGGGLSLKGLLDRRSGRGRRGRQGRDVENVFDRELLREQEQHLRLLRERSGNLVEINEIDHQLIGINHQQRLEQIDQQVKRKALTAKQAEQLRLEAEKSLVIERELADRKLAQALIEESYRSSDEMLRLEQEALDLELRMARTDEERERLELVILSLKHQQARSEIEKQIALAKEANDEARIAELTEQRLRLIENQHRETAAFEIEHLRGFEKFRNDLPRTVDEINEQIENIRFDLFIDRLERAADFARDLGDAFGQAAGDLVRFRNPLDILRNLIGGLAETFTRNFVEQPISDWATRAIGGPLAKRFFGDDLTGPDTLTVQQMNVALGLATNNLNMLSQAAAMASANMGGAAGAAGAADALTGAAQSATGALNEQTPAVGQFGGALMQIIGSLSGGGGGGAGFFGALLNIGASALGGIGGGSAAGAAAGGGTPIFTPSNPGVGFAGGGFTGMGRDNEIAGPVHRNEFVFDADATRRLGVPMLEMIAAGRLPRFAPPTSSPGQRPVIANFGGIHVHGARDDRSARRSGRQALAQFQRGLGQVNRAGLNK